MTVALSPDLVGTELPSRSTSWTKHDVILYAVGVGARPDNGLDFIYEGRGPKVLPTYAVVPGMNIIGGLGSVIEMDMSRLLHGEQGITLHRPLPPVATVTSTSRIVEVWDKGKAAVVGMEGVCSDEEGPLFSVYASLFIIGGGGFGGERGPSSSKAALPDRDPDHVVEDATRPEQAAVYRLSGDRNPMHIDPDFAKRSGFSGPFLHGLCTYGFAGRAILDRLCGGDPARFVEFHVRFADQVWPGDTIVTKIWDLGDGHAQVQAETQRGNVVLSQATAGYR